MDLSVGVFCGLLMGVVKEAVPPQKKKKMDERKINSTKIHQILGNITLHLTTSKSAVLNI